MTRRVSIEQRFAIGTLVAALLAVATVVISRGWSGASEVLAAALVAASLLVVVKLPWGGTAPLGYAIVIALTITVSPGTFAVVAGLALLLTVPFLVTQRGVSEAGRSLAVWTVGTAAAGVTTVVARHGLPLGHKDAARALMILSLAGLAFLGVDLLLRRAGVLGRDERVDARAAGPLYISLLCGAALLGLAYREGGWWMAAISLGPLLLTRFSFERYAAARQTYRQTIQALSIVPEVAELAPLGHSERTAAYALALAGELNLGPDATERVATAARLHHIGGLSLDELGMTGPDAVASLGASLIGEIGFLSGVAGVVAGSAAPLEERDTIEAAIVRIASRFDDFVGDDAGRARDSLRLVAFESKDRYGRQVVAALRKLVLARPRLALDAIASAVPVTSAAGVLAMASTVELQYQA
jgi:hypothetical protein